MNTIHDDSAFLKTLTLLHVEDDPDTREQLSRFLRNRVGTLITAANGSAGLTAFDAHRPAIVVTDIQMPEMDGLALAQAIKSSEQNRDTAIPVIVTTAFEQTNYLMRAIDIGIDKYIVKPIDPARLHQALLECAYRLRIVAEKTELEAQNRQLQKAESLSRMAGAIAHHFNNHLQAVMGNLELALSEMPAGDPDTVTDCLNEAMEAAHRASEVSGLMLTYLGQTPARRSPQDISSICRKSLPLFIAGLPKDVRLETDLSPTCPAVLGNDNQIRQVLTNLIGNAREAMESGEKVIHLSVREAAAENIPATFRFPAGWAPKNPVYACIEISDTGCGIPAADIEKIFDPFFTSKFTGRGMGLPVTLGIVHAHGGAITVESEPGRGSVFRVFLPMAADSSPLNTYRSSRMPS